MNQEPGKVAPISVGHSIDSIGKCLREAENDSLSRFYNPAEFEHEEDHSVVTYCLERAFIEFLILVEHLGLSETYRSVAEMFTEARKNFLEEKMGPAEEPYLVWSHRLRVFADSVASVHGLGDRASIDVLDLKATIKRSVYVICDTKLFASLPGDEADVHDRIEGILKCHRPDLRRKPALAKPIKNFIPDTGIPSLKTLIEYKFVADKAEAKRVADEILADASGYRSPEWRNLLFVVYETHRVLPEEEWVSLLRDCGLGENFDAVVLSGDAQVVVK